MESGESLELFQIRNEERFGRFLGITDFIWLDLNLEDWELAVGGVGSLSFSLFFFKIREGEK